MARVPVNDYHDGRLGSRQIDELIGLCRGFAVRGALSQSDIEFVRDWFDRNLRVSDAPLVKDVFDLIEDTLSDGAVDSDEAEKVLEAFRGLTGEYGPDNRLHPMTLHFDDEDEVAFEEFSFCFTGRFATWSRNDCEQAVREVGGYVHKRMTTETEYLVVGSIATDSWKHASFGKKIMDAVRWRDEYGVAIISEEHWLRSIKEVAPNLTPRSQRNAGSQKSAGRQKPSSNGSSQYPPREKPTESSSSTPDEGFRSRKYSIPTERFDARKYGFAAHVRRNEMPSYFWPSFIFLVSFLVVFFGAVIVQYAPG